MRQTNSIRNPEVYNKFLDVGAAFNKGLMMATRGGTISTNNPVGAVKNNYESKIENYLNKLPQGADLTKVPDAYRNDVQKFLMGQKQNYVKLSRELSQYEVGSNRYIDLQGQMNNISNSFKNLNSQLANYSEKKVELMNNIKTKTTSLYGENQANVNLLSNIFSEEYPISIDEFGRISFVGDDKVLKYEDIPNYNTKEYKLADAITDMSVKAYVSGKKMLKGGIMYTKYKNDITSAVDQGGKPSLMSLIHDGLVGDTKMISDPYIAENVKAYENGGLSFEALRDVVVDNYMDVVVRNSDTGYKAKQVAASKRQGTGGGSNKYYSMIPTKNEFGETTGYIRSNYDVSQPSLILTVEEYQSGMPFDSPDRQQLKSATETPSSEDVPFSATDPRFLPKNRAQAAKKQKEEDTNAGLPKLG